MMNELNNQNNNNRITGQNNRRFDIRKKTGTILNLR